MKSSKMIIIVIGAFWTAVCPFSVSKAAPMGTVITYQGRLLDANEPADGLYDFGFRLFDDPCTGTQQGSTIDISDVDVIDGYFTVELNFGSGVFSGEAMWLDISVRPGDSNEVHTTLSPRQAITVAPYALYAASGAERGVGEAGEFDGEVNYDMVEDSSADTTFNFASPFTTTAKPHFYVTVVLKGAANGLVEGAAIKAVEDIKGMAGNWTGFDLTVSKYSDGSSISDTTQVYVTWMAVRKE